MWFSCDSIRNTNVDYYSNKTWIWNEKEGQVFGVTYISSKRVRERERKKNIQNFVSIVYLFLAQLSRFPPLRATQSVCTRTNNCWRAPWWCMRVCVCVHWIETKQYRCECTKASIEAIRFQIFSSIWNESEYDSRNTTIYFVWLNENIMHSKLLNCCKHTHTHTMDRNQQQNQTHSQFNHFDRKNHFCLPLYNIQEETMSERKSMGKGKNRLKQNTNWHTNYKCNFIAVNVGTRVTVVNSLSNGLSTADFSTRISMTNRNKFSFTRRVCVDECWIYID